MVNADDFFEQIFLFFKPRRVALFAGVLIVLSVAGAVVGLKLRPQENIAAMLPDDDSRVAHDFKLLGLAPFSRKVLMTVSSDVHDPDALIQASRTLESALVQTQAFQRVEGGFDAERGMQIMDAFSGIHPCLFSDADMSAVRASVDDERVAKQVKGNLRTLMSPDGMLEKNRILSDPMNYSRFSLSKLEGTRMVSGVTVRNGRFLDSTGNHALVVAETDVEITDSAGAKRLIAAFDGAAATLPRGFRAEMLSGHRYSIANGDVIRRDLSLVLTLTVLGLLAVFLIYLRQWRSLYVFIFPAAVLLIALAVVTLVFDDVSAITIGFGAVLMGISVDFALHLYFAAKGKGGGLAGLKEIAKPGSFCAITTISAFAVLLQSNLPGQRQLAVFCVAGLLAAVCLAFVVLPHVLPDGEPSLCAFGLSFLDSGGKLPRKPVLVVWVILVLVALPFATKLRFDGDMRKLGAQPPELKALEKQFREVWGDFRGRAMVFVKGKSMESALETNDSVYVALSNRLKSDEMVSVAPILPSRKTQMMRAESWRSFVKERSDELCAMMMRAGWPPRATSAFRKSLHVQPATFDMDSLRDVGLGQVLDSLVLVKDGETWLISLVPDRAELATFLKNKFTEDVYFVSQSETGQAIGTAIAKDFKRFVTLALIAVVVLVTLLYRRLRLIIAALVPVFSGVLGLFAVMGAVHMPMNIFNVIASILIIGLGVDYGIFMVEKTRTGADGSITAAVWVSGLTTLAGFGALVFGRHPALFSIGLTVVVGIVFAILSALFVVPSVVKDSSK